MSLQTYAEYPRVVYNTRRSLELGNLARVSSASRNILVEKTAVDAAIVSDLEKMGSRVLKSLKLLKSEDLGKLLAIGGVGALGAAGGAAYAGARAEDSAKEQINKALLAALGLSAASYGLGKMSSAASEKTSSHHAELYEKIAAAAEVAFMTREVVMGNGPQDLKKYAAEVSATANAHIADMLSKVIL